MWIFRLFHTNKCQVGYIGAFRKICFMVVIDLEVYMNKS